MTTPKPPIPPNPEGPAQSKPAAGATPGKDALAGLPPMPRTKPKKAPKPPQTVDGAPLVTRKDLFDRVKAQTGKVKGSDVRVVMDAVLDELGAAMVKGETLRLPSLGTLKVQRHKPQDKSDVVICKLNRKKRKSGAKDPLAKPAEDR